jgi:hypothetical protein
MGWAPQEAQHLFHRCMLPLPNHQPTTLPPSLLPSFHPSFSSRLFPLSQACHHPSKFGIPLGIWALGRERKNGISMIACFSVISRDLFSSSTTLWAICFADIFGHAPTGTSPEFELALYTLCFLTGQETNRVRLGSYNIIVTCHKIARDVRTRHRPPHRHLPRHCVWRGHNLRWLEIRRARRGFVVTGSRHNLY